MTRFARAKGSKASNERVPNEATPWHVMKQQLDHTSPKDDNQGKSKSARKLLQEADAANPSGSGGKDNNTWAQFEDVEHKKKKTPKKATKGIKQKQEGTNVKPKLEDSTDVSNKNAEQNPSIVNSDNLPQNKQQKHNFKRKNENFNNSTPNKFPKYDNASRPNGQTDTNFQAGQNAHGFNKRNMNSFNRGNPNSFNARNTNSFNRGNPNSFNRGNTSHFNRGHANNFHRHNTRPNYQNSFQGNQLPPNKQKPPKVRDDKEHKRRKPDNGPVKLMINGMEVVVVLYDGFQVRQEDATRLAELKEKMVLKGIPQTDIANAMKLERRKAEKALARIRKCVCFNCRKAGHNLSDCPELAAEQSGTGICFKCGSTEHTHFECKVTKPTEFRFATCFICREQGHIAKQCPDNPKGVYPQGGACKVCGDVTHLKKDCPDLAKEKEETAVTLDKIADDALECLEGEVVQKSNDTDKKRVKKKVVKF